MEREGMGKWNIDPGHIQHVHQLPSYHVRRLDDVEATDIWHRSLGYAQPQVGRMFLGFCCASMRGVVLLSTR